MPAAVRVRTVTAFCDVRTADDPTLAEALIFVQDARARLQAAGYEVQTLRVGTRLPRARPDQASFDRVGAIDRRVAENGALWATGPELAAADLERFTDWCARALAHTTAMFSSVDIADAGRGVDAGACRAAARTIARVARETDGGEGNFRFAAAAGCPPGLPFFPAARHDGTPAFAIGLESAGIVELAYRERPVDPTGSLRGALDLALAPIEAVCETLASESGRRFVGIDVSPAPGLDASIAGPIESILGAPFGSAGTLRACAATTAALQATCIRRCGYSGLMLPVLEDRVLAARADEGRYGIRDLLLWSSVCGTGLDVVPLAGDVSEDDLTRTLTDVGALSVRLGKPLSARLLPVPGLRAGERSRFTHPLLVNARIFGV